MDKEKETKLQTRGINALDYAKTLEVRDEKSKGAASKALSLNKDIQKDVNDYFGPTIKKAKDLHSDLVGKKKGFLDPLKKSEDILKQKISVYLQEQERIRQEAIRKAREEEAKREAQEEDETKELPATITIVPEETKLEGFHKRKDWKWRVKNFDLIPRPLLTTKDTEINAIVRRDKEKTNIPGIEAYCEESISQSRGKAKDPY